MYESGNWEEDKVLTEDALKELLVKKIEMLDVASAKEEVRPFIKDRGKLDFWTQEYFMLLVEKMKFET